MIKKQRSKTRKNCQVATAMYNNMKLYDILYLFARAKHIQINFFKIHSKLFSNELQKNTQTTLRNHREKYYTKGRMQPQRKDLLHHP